MLHITKIKPRANYMLVTADTFDKDMIEKGVIVAKKGDLKLWQSVLAIGPMIRNIEIGDKVMINPMKYAVRKYNQNSVQNDLDNNPVLSYNFPFETIEDSEGNPQECLYISDDAVKYAFEGEEKDDALIIPGKKKFII